MPWVSTDPAPWYVSPGWDFLGVAAAVVVVPMTLYQVWALVRDRRPRRLVYGLLASAPMLTGPSSARQRVAVTFDGTAVQNPRVVTLRLAHRGRKDIAPDSFVGRPMRLELGTTIMEILDTDPGPGHDGPIPHSVSPQATALLIGPGVIRAQQQTTWVLLTDGPAPSPTCHDRPLDVQVTYQDTPESPATMMTRTTTAATVVVAATGAAATVTERLVTAAAVLATLAVWAMVVVSAMAVWARRR